MPESPSIPIRSIPPAPQAQVAEADYAELDVTSNFSFLRGASHPDELVFQAAQLGYRAIAIADRNSLAGVVRAHDAARQVGEQGGRPPRLVIGARLALVDGPEVLAWCTDRAAYGRLCRLLTLGRRRARKGECELALADLLDHAAGLRLAIVPEPAALRAGPPPMPWQVLREALGDRLSIAASCLYRDDHRLHLAALHRHSRQLGAPLLACNDVHYHDPARRRLQDVLACIRHGCTIHEAGLRLFPNAERHLKPPAAMRRLFLDCPQAIRRSLEMAEACAFSLDELRYEYPDEIVPPGRRPIEHLADLAWRGAAARYPAGLPEKVEALIRHELELIEKLKYEAYFLTVHDLVEFARSRGILCQGRGSAANSAVCYCLGITSVDPSRIDVLFERFISAARNEPPDIDVDFEHERREEVLQYLYEKYGRERAGMTAEVITYRGRSAVRDVGKALGLSLDLVDQMARKLDFWHGGTLTESQLRELSVDPADSSVKQVIDLTSQLLGFPRHLSQHVGGMVMTRGPLCELVPIENASMPGRTVIEWDKNDIDALGILKVDVLALGMLTCISKALRLIELSRGEACLALRDSPNSAAGVLTGGVGATHGAPSVVPCRGDACVALRGPQSYQRMNEGRGMPRPYGRGVVGDWTEGDACVASAKAVGGEGIEGEACLAPTIELHTIPPEDPSVYAMISRADTVGVFQIESRAQMSMLPRLRPRCFYDLVIEVAIVRPGPIQGNMVHPYLRRRNGEEPVSYPSEALRQVLEKTLGVPLFQEQAMRVAMVGAGFSADDADRLRRAMAAWRRGGSIDAFRARIIDGMIANGYTPQFAEQCFLQIRGFGEYGFPESHAASFALLVYVSAWIKHYYPAHFCAALLNSQPMGFYAPAQIVRDAQAHGVPVHPPDINASDWDCTLEPAAGDGAPPPVRLGFRQVKGLRQDQLDALVEERRRRGTFLSLSDLHQRTRLPRHVIQRLAEADAFASLGLSRRQALWQALELCDEQLPLFDLSAPPPAPAPLPPMPIGQEVLTDYRTAGLSLKRHPVALVRGQLDELGIVPAEKIADLRNGMWVRVAGIVLVRQRPSTANGILFATLEDETGIVNLIVRPAIYERYRREVRQATLLHAEGNIERQGQVIHVMAWRLYDRTGLLQEAPFKTRDFR